MTKRTILIFIFAPLIGLAQPITFTEEERDYVNELVEKLKKRMPLPSDELYEVLYEGLEVVPFHPIFIQTLLREKIRNQEYAFVYDYCNKLDNEYLSEFQSILFNPCAYAYFMKDDYESLYYRIIPMIEDRNIRGLYLMAYYAENEQNENFLEHAKYALQNSYEFEILNHLKNAYLKSYIRYVLIENNPSKIKNFLNEFEEAFFSSDLPTYTYSRLIRMAIIHSNFTLAKKLIDYVEELYPEKYKYLYPVVAYYHSFIVGEEDLTKKALDEAYKMDKLGFLDAYPSDHKDLRTLYVNSISLLGDFEDKKKYVEQGIRYFEDIPIPIYKTGLRLYQSMLLASEDMKSAQKILKEYETILDKTSYSFLSDILIALNEVDKKKPDYRKVDAVLNELVKAYDFYLAYYHQVMFRYKVNYNSKKPVFTLNEIVEPFEYIQSNSPNQYKEFYLRKKLVIIGESDNEWMMRELERLPEDVADEFIESFSSQHDDSEELKETISKNEKELENIKVNVDYLVLRCLNNVIFGL